MHTRKTAFRLSLYVFSTIFFFAWGATSAKADFSVVLQNKTGLSANQYTVWVLGYSTASQLMLASDGTFTPFTQQSGAIPSTRLGRRRACCIS